METKLRFWKEGKFWYCAVPRDDWFTKNGLGWKTHGLIGRGETRNAAEQDWKLWKDASDIIADCNL